jgi:hypothetical protein
MIPRSALVLLVGLVLLTCPLAATALETFLGEILANPNRFDGQTVTLKGTITHFCERVSRAGNGVLHVRAQRRPARREGLLLSSTSQKSSVSAPRTS